MHVVSDLYRELLEKDARREVRLSIGETGNLITKRGEKITFGGVSILIGTTGADGGFDENTLYSMKTNNSVFSDNMPEVGCCIAGEIDVEMRMPSGEIPKKSRLVPYIRLTDGVRSSEWIQKGVFYIDTRQIKDDGSSIKKIAIHGYDDMLKAEQDYPQSALEWPAKDIDIVREIAAFMDVDVDRRTINQMAHGYKIQYPAGYSCRETLGFIAGMYAGCFIMSDLGELQLITLNEIPPETRYLITSSGEAITFGGVRILV